MNENDETVDEVRSSKRRRTSETAKTAPSLMPKTFAHHEKLWFEDGNIVLVSDNTAFKVHRGVLGFHSSVFADMFTLPQPPDDDAEIYCGCPLVHLQDDANHMAHFLLILYGGGSQSVFLYSRMSPPIADAFCSPYLTAQCGIPFTLVRAMLKLATKYNVQYIADQAIRCLKHGFPSTLQKYDQWYSLHEENRLMKIEARDAIAAIDLARDHNLNFILPAAFVLCTSVDISVLISGVVYGRERVTLSLQDLEMFMKGKDALLAANTTITNTLLEPTTDPLCPNRRLCLPKLHRLASFGGIAGLLADHQPFKKFDVWLEIAATNNLLLCPSCESSLRARFNEQRLAAWNDLGRIFGVEPWPSTG